MNLIVLQFHIDKINSVMKNSVFNNRQNRHIFQPTGRWSEFISDQNKELLISEEPNKVMLTQLLPAGT